MDIKDIYNSWKQIPCACSPETLKLYSCSAEASSLPCFFSRDHLGDYLFVLKLPEEDVYDTPSLESLQGCGSRIASLSGQQYFVLSLEEHDTWSLFKSLCREIFNDFQEGAYLRNDKVVRRLNEILRRFSQFFKKSKQNFSREQAVGLWGELYFLRNVIFPLIAPTEAILFWKGPTAADKDFILPRALVEVKTTEQEDDKQIKISNLKQLSDEPGKVLYIYLNVIHEVESGMSGLSLNELVSSIRALLEKHDEALITFNALLGISGYLESSPYAEKEYLFRTGAYYPVTDDFPRLTHTNIPCGIVAAKYTVDLSSQHQSLFTPELF